MDTGLSIDLQSAARDAFAQRPDVRNAKEAYSKNRQNVREVAEQFEAMFLSQMFGHMFKGVKTDGLMGGGNGEAIFRDMLVQEYGNQVSKAGGIGLSASIERQLLALQEGK
jgi:flagellar protein FlgJ